MIELHNKGKLGLPYLCCQSIVKTWLDRDGVVRVWTDQVIGERIAPDQITSVNVEHPTHWRYHEAAVLGPDQILVFENHDKLLAYARKHGRKEYCISRFKWFAPEGLEGLTVGELITYLKTQNPDAPVMITREEGNTHIGLVYNNPLTDVVYLSAPVETDTIAKLKAVDRMGY